MRSIAFVLLLLSSPALAGSLTFSATTAQGTVTQTVTVSDADLLRVVAAYKKLFDLDAGLTNAQVFTAIAKAVFGKIKADVQDVEQRAAAQSASDSVTTVTMQ